MTTPPIAPRDGVFRLLETFLTAPHHILRGIFVIAVGSNLHVATRHAVEGEEPVA